MGTDSSAQTDLTLDEMLADLGIAKDYGQEPFIPRYEEATELVDGGQNVLGRMLQMTPPTAAAWQRLSAAAVAEGVQIILVSGYRSHAYQYEIMKAKLESGRSIEDVLKVNAAPGFSEHHTGEAIDVATPGCKPLIEDFEYTEAFLWLARRAGDFGFSLSYPRDNPYGFVYEPWHWRYSAAD